MVAKKVVKKPIDTILNIIKKKRFIWFFAVFLWPLVFWWRGGYDELFPIFLFWYFFVISFDIKNKWLKIFLIILLWIFLLSMIINLSRHWFA